MEYSTLGSSELSVSRVCLGSMTWGIQNNQLDADQQINYALSQGVNFIDTAEMYPVPPNKNSYGHTENIIGHWLRANPNKRNQIVIASKIAGSGLNYIRQGSAISGKTITLAVEESLKRLQTDYIDLYQLHWPNRTSPHFGKHWPNQVPFSDTNGALHKEQMHEILSGLQDCINAGKIRHCGLSDDTPWGINTYLTLAKEFNLPKMVSIQNEFNLLHTKDWPYLIENCIHENVAYLPWSPLAGGMLSGKYLHGQRPQGSRWTLMQRHGLFRDTESSEQAIASFCNIAKKHGYSAPELALTWCDQVDGVTSTIIGATSLEQLTENINAFTMSLSEEVKIDINKWLKRYPSPF
ncbi:aldo/keto reductase [Thalassotalea ganghwensis]